MRQIPETSNYKLLFGGVLGQELTVNLTRNDEDIAAAIQISLERMYGNSIKHHHVTKVTKHVSTCSKSV